tara:strand:+ start:770 stop:1627 length:858 start_codon:yes stop_codon:yes gene_type:complete
MNKIILGSANFGSKYGVTNTNDCKILDVEDIIDFAKKNEIKAIDTAPDYGDSEIILGNTGVNQFKISTKVNIPNHNNGLEKYLLNNVKTSLKRLKQKKVFSILFRKPGNLLNTRKIKLWNYAKELKSRGYFEKLGITIYDPEELHFTFNKLKPEIVQIPYNIFDQRFEKSGWLDKLHNENIIIQVRSVFLQGLLLCSYEDIPKNFKVYDKYWKAYKNWLSSENLTPIQACINFNLQNKKISNVIVGVESKKQLEEIIKVKKKIIKPPKIFDNISRQLIDPRLWRN